MPGRSCECGTCASIRRILSGSSPLPAALLWLGKACFAWEEADDKSIDAGSEYDAALARVREIKEKANAVPRLP